MKRTCASVMVCVFLLGACHGPEKISEGVPYPTAIKRGPALDIQVIRHVTEIAMTNTSGRGFGASRMWLNGRFSHEIKGFAVGETLTLRLGDFKDQYGDVFKGGGFFAIERAEMLALAELETQGTMRGLVVISVQEQ